MKNKNVITVRRLCFFFFVGVLFCLGECFLELDIDCKEMVHLASRSDHLYFPRHFHQQAVSVAFWFHNFPKTSAFSNL